MQIIEKVKHQAMLLPVDPMITSAPPNDETTVTQIQVESFVSPLTIAYSNEPIICMLLSIRNFISRHIAFDNICKPIVHLAWCLFVIIPFLSFADVSKIPLTPEEISWLNAKHTVRVRLGNAPPFMITDGEVRGIAIDYLTKIFNYHEIQYSYVLQSEVTWPQALKYIENHDVVDIVPTAKITDERKKHMLFTNEYISAPWVIFTRSNSGFIGSIEDLKGKTVSVQEGYVIQAKLQNNYPEIKLKVVSAQLENFANIPLKDLSTGLVDAYVGNLLATTYLIQSLGYTNVKVAAPTPFDNHNQAMAIRDDWPELRSIINKTLDAMTPEEHIEIRNRWLSVRYEYGISYTDVLRWILSILTVASLVVGFVLFWNRRLKKEVVLREKIEADLLKSENRLRSALDATPFPVAFSDLNAEEILYWSRSALSLFGHNVVTISEWYEAAYPDPGYRQNVIERWKPFPEIAKKSELPVNTGEYQITCKDGSVKTCEIYVTVITDLLIVTFNDITLRKNAEKFLIEGRATLKGALESMSDAVFISDADGKFIEFNEAFATFHRLQSKEECLLTLPEWTSYLDVYSDDGKLLPLDMWVVSRALRGEQGVNEICKLKRRDTGEAWFGSFNFAPIYDKEGDITGSVVVARDITEKRQIQAQLIQAQKMESIGNLAGGIAHDFNNILSSIIGFTELALEAAPSGSAQRDDLEEVYNAGNRAKELVQQILAFARQSDQEIRPVRLSDLVTEVLKLLRPSTPTDIDIKPTINSTATVMGNPSQLHQVVLNICTNAIHSMQKSGGVLEIGLRDIVLAKDHEPETSGLPAGEYIEFTVTDSGSGIDPTIIGKIFEPYFTTKGVGEGSGMGLAMVKGIVEIYGGDIQVKSEPRKKTSFVIRIPVATTKSLDIVVDQVDSVLAGTERILFVDDEPPIAQLGSRILESLGYTVTIRTSSFDALELFKEKPDDFNLVITDMTMPSMTGDLLSMELRKIRPNIPIILCTGYSNKINDEGAKKIGIDAFASKPFTKFDLAKTIREVLDKKRIPSD